MRFKKKLLSWIMTASVLISPLANITEVVAQELDSTSTTSVEQQVEPTTEQQATNEVTSETEVTQVSVSETTASQSKASETSQTKQSEEQEVQLEVTQDNAVIENDNAITIDNNSELVEADELELGDFNKLVQVRATNDTKKVSEADGTKIEAIRVDFVEKEGKSLVREVYNDNSYKHIQARVNFALSGKEDYKPGTIKITIPKHIFRDRQGKLLSISTIAVPKSPDNSGLFSYIEQDGNYIIINNKKLSAATSAMFEVTYRNIVPSEIKDYVTGYKTDKLQPEIEVITHKGTKLSKESNFVQAEVDTSGKLNSTVLKAVGGTYSKWQSSWPTEFKPANSDNYVYVPYTIYNNTSANQYYKMVLNLSADNGGKFVGYRDNSQRKNHKLNSSSANIVLSKSDYNNDGQNYFGTIYVAYPKSQFTSNKDYKLNITAKHTMTTTDDKQKTTSQDSKFVIFSPATIERPDGHILIVMQGDRKTTNRWNAEHKKNEGIYSISLDEIKENKPVEFYYYIRSGMYGGPWTLKEGGNPENLNDYNQKPYKVVQVNNGELTLGNDFKINKNEYDIVGLRVDKPYLAEYVELSDSTNTFEGPNGLLFTSDNDSRYVYKGLEDDSKLPKLSVYGKKSSGDYILLAEVDYTKPKNQRYKFYNGASLGLSTKEDYEHIKFPEGIKEYKVEGSTKESYLKFETYPKFKLYPTDRVKNYVKNLYDNSLRPETIAKNTAKTEGYDYKDKFIGDIGDFGRDLLMGFSNGVKLNKSIDYNNDTKNRVVNIKYNIEAEIQTNQESIDLIKEATRKGLYFPTESGTFYDLLPKGVKVDTSSLKVRQGDSIKSIEVKENYKNSGRDLLIVKVDLTPNYRYNYKSADSILGVPGLVDRPSLTFNAKYSWLNLSDYGKDLTNRAVFESDAKEFGNVKKLMGEPDNPTFGNNQHSLSAVEDDKDILTNINSSNDNATYIYAKSKQSLVVDTYATTSLSKLVDVNNEGVYGQGLDIYTPKNVYEGGVYEYKIRMKNSTINKAEDIIFYDNLENYKPQDENKDDIQFRGKLLNIDVQQLIDSGVNPVVYYSTTKNLVLDDTENRAHNDLTNKKIWSTTKPANVEDITAIAVDARKFSNGGKFILERNKSLSVHVKMQAPLAKNLGLADYTKAYDTDSKVEAGIAGGVHAYNNISMLHTTISTETNSKSVNQLITNNYTKVGLLRHSIKVNKLFNDDNNRDGIRPDSVTVNLIADGLPTGEKLVLNKDNKFSGEFKDTPYSTLEGKPIQYSIIEEPNEGYVMNIAKVTKDDKGIIYDVENYHEPEKINIEGVKHWKDLDALNRPEKIRINLFKNGSLYQTKTIRATDQSNDWKFSFDNLFKYENGKEIEYSIKELDYVKGYVSEIKDFTITNTYDPYTDVVISKSIIDGTEASRAKNNDFSFVFYLYEGDKVIGKQYAYTKSNGETGYITPGEKFTLKEDENITIHRVDSDKVYKVEEVNLPKGFGFSARDSENYKGTLQAGRPQQVKIVNNYVSKTEVNLDIEKQLLNRELRQYQFLFDIFEVDDSGNRGQRVMAGYNNEEGKVIVGSLRFTNKDLGKKHLFDIVERQDNKRPGYTYDSKTVRVTIELTDNGDGTITPKVSYANMNVDSETGDKPGLTDKAKFVNTYKAEGSVTLKAWKQVEGNIPLKDREFSFTLTDKATGKEVGKAVNNKDGEIVFPRLNFTEQDIGKTYTYIAKEDVLEDRKDIYFDSSALEYEIEVFDNGDGTLSFNSKVNKVKPSGVASLDTFVNNEVFWRGIGKTQISVGVLNTPDSIVDIIANDNNGNNIPAMLNSGDNKILLTINVMQKSSYYIVTIKKNAGFTVNGNDTILTEYKYKVYFDGKDNVYTESDFPLVDDTQSKEDGEINQPIFTNKYKPGKLSIEKQANGGNQDEYFDYKVKLHGDPNVIPKGEFKLNREPVKEEPQETIVHWSNRFYFTDGNINLRGVPSLSLENPFKDRNYHAFGTEHNAKVYNKGEKIVIPRSQFNFYPPENVNKTFGYLSISEPKEVRVYKVNNSNYNYNNNYSGRTLIERPGGGNYKIGDILELEPGEYEVEHIIVFSRPDSGNYNYNSYNVITPNSKILNLISEEDQLELSPELNLQAVQASQYNSLSELPYALNRTMTNDEIEHLYLRDIQKRYINRSTRIIYQIRQEDSSTHEEKGLFTLFSNGHLNISGELSNALRQWDDYYNGPKYFVVGDSLDELLFAKHIVSNLDNQDYDVIVKYQQLGKEIIQDIVSISFSDNTIFPKDFSGYLVKSLGTNNSLTIIDLENVKLDNIRYINNLFSTRNIDFTNIKILGLSRLVNGKQYDEAIGLFAMSKFNYLDFTNFNTKGTTVTKGMFKGTKISKLKLGKNTKLGLDSELGAPDTSNLSGKYTGKWIREDGVYGPWTGKELLENYKGGDMAGTYVPEKAPTTYTVKFNLGKAQGNMPNKTLEEYDWYSLPLPSNISYPGYTFKGWARTPDGEPMSAPYRRLTSPGNTITLYAIWEKLDTSVNIENGEFTVKVKAGEKVTIDNLPAGLTYSIEELSKPNWVLESSENTTGKIEALQESAAKFTNKYSPKSTSLQLRATKLLDGQPASNFSFTLKELNSGKTHTITSDNNGNIELPNFVYSKKGTYRYTLQENKGTDSSIKYDTHTANITVNVSSDAEGYLTVNHNIISSDNRANPMVFNNEKLPAELVLRKVVQGTTNKEDFTFEITRSDMYEPQRITIKAGEQKIIQLPFGTKYSVKEVDLPYGYDLASINGLKTNEISGTADKLKTEIVFTNKYSARGSVNIKAKKILEGKRLEGNDFKFELYDEQQKNILSTATNDKEGNIAFDSIEISGAGQKTFYIKEVLDKQEGITYDSQPKKVVLKAVDDGRGFLNITTESETPEFKNKYTPKDPEVTEQETSSLAILKYVSAGDINKEFKFDIKFEDKNGNELTNEFEASLNGQGFISIKSGDTISIKPSTQKPSDFGKYPVQNFMNKIGGLIIDRLPVGTKVTLTEHNSDGYNLESATFTRHTFLGPRSPQPVPQNISGTGNTRTVEITSGASTLVHAKIDVLEFTNNYSATGELLIKANKLLANEVDNGKTIADYKFEFLLIDDETGRVVERVTNDEQGKINFSGIPYSVDDIGKEFRYIVVENDMKVKDIITDKSEYVIKAKVLDNGDGTLKVEQSITKDGKPVDSIEFVNTYNEEVPLPITGKFETMAMFVSAMTILPIGLWLLNKKRKTKEDELS